MQDDPKLKIRADEMMMSVLFQDLLRHMLNAALLDTADTGH